MKLYTFFMTTFLCLTVNAATPATLHCWIVDDASYGAKPKVERGDVGYMMDSVIVQGKFHSCSGSVSTDGEYFGSGTLSISIGPKNELAQSIAYTKKSIRISDKDKSIELGASEEEGDKHTFCKCRIKE